MFQKLLNFFDRWSKFLRREDLKGIEDENNLQNDEVNKISSLNTLKIFSCQESC